MELTSEPYRKIPSDNHWSQHEFLNKVHKYFVEYESNV